MSAPRPCRLAPLALLAVLLPAGSPAADPPAAVWDPNRVWPVHLALSAAEYAAMQPRSRGPFPWSRPPADQAPADPTRELHRNTFGMDLPWATGSVQVGDQEFGQVGVRYKGNGTLGDAARTAKKSFKIVLDRAGGTGRFAGSKTINLHCGVTDPTKCRESLGYELFRAAGVPAPRTTLAEVRLTVPGKFDRQLLGVYTLVEEPDKPFQRHHLGTDAGLLLKPEGNRDFEYRGDDWGKYEKGFDPRRPATPAEAARLIAFSKLVHTADDAAFRAEIGSFLDVDNYLRFLAVTAFAANTDSFFVLGHNYLAHLHPATHKLQFLPWDLDRSFANFPILGTARKQMDLSLSHPYAGPHRLTDRLLAVPGMPERYRKLLGELAATAFAERRLLDRVAALDAAVKPLREQEIVAAAGRKEPPPTQTFGFGQPPALDEFVRRRTRSLAAQVAGTSKGFVPPAPGNGPPAMGAVLAGPMLESLDADRDEKVSRGEWLGLSDRLWAACKPDPDGRVDLRKLTAGVTALLPAPPPGGPPGGFSPAGFLAGGVLTRADADTDGRLTAGELRAAAEAVFDAADGKRAGTLDEPAFEKLLSGLFPPPKFGPPPKGPPGKK